MVDFTEEPHTHHTIITDPASIVLSTLSVALLTSMRTANYEGMLEVICDDGKAIKISARSMTCSSAGWIAYGEFITGEGAHNGLFCIRKKSGKLAKIELIPIHFTNKYSSQYPGHTAFEWTDSD